MKKTSKTTKNVVENNVPEDAYYSIQAVIDQLNDTLTELQLIGLPQEMIDETETKILDAITEAESLQLEFDP